MPKSKKMKSNWYEVNKSQCCDVLCHIQGKKLEAHLVKSGKLSADTLAEVFKGMNYTGYLLPIEV